MVSSCMRVLIQSNRVKRSVTLSSGLAASLRRRPRLRSFSVGQGRAASPNRRVCAKSDHENAEGHSSPGSIFLGSGPGFGYRFSRSSNPAGPARKFTTSSCRYTYCVGVQTRKVWICSIRTLQCRMRLLRDFTVSRSGQRGRGSIRPEFLPLCESAKDWILPSISRRRNEGS